MGRKKQKVRWTSVEDAGFFDPELEQESRQLTESEFSQYQRQDMSRHSRTPSGSTNSCAKFQMTSGPPRRSSGGGFWSSASLPPRFERSKAMMHHAIHHDHDLDSNCETEELPNGFTKIRSKNLDVLFRKDYYAQRMLSTTSSSAVSSEAGEPTEEDVISLNEPVAEEDEEEDVEDSSQTPEAISEVKEKQEDRQTEIQKEKPLSSKINTNALPFYPSNYNVAPPPQQMATTTTGQQPPVSSANNMPGTRPNLFLYSPTSNTMIPCEEIIIPNAVVPGSEVYQGPSNIYLAFPMENNAGAPGAAAAAAGANSNSASSPSSSNVGSSPGTSSNCTPPQAQSPPTSYAAGGTMVQYDQYGVPYTTYTPTVVAPNGGSTNGDAEATSTSPQSPSDLSVYHPTNWVPDPNYLAATATPSLPPHPYYYYQQPYYNFRNGHASYQYHFIESSAVPSSAGESPNEDRSEGEDTTTTPTTATTTTSNSPKKEGGVAHKQPSDSESCKNVFIPGLPVNLKPARPTKKRRKKKQQPAQQQSSNGLLASVNDLEQAHRGSSSSEANEKNNVLQAITILQREESEDLQSIQNEEIPEEDSKDQEEQPQATQQEDEAEAEQDVEEVLVVVKEDAAAAAVKNVEEAVEEVTEENVKIEKEEEQTIVNKEEEEEVPEVSVKPPRPHRRRRGARKSEKNKKLLMANTAMAKTNDDLLDVKETSNYVPEEWEQVPKEITVDPNDGWEMATGRKGNAATSGNVVTRRLHVTPMESRDVTPDHPERISIVVEQLVDNKPEEEVVEESKSVNEASASAPVSRKSTLKRNRKKRASLDDGSQRMTSSSSLSKPVLISDRDFDVASAVAAQRRYNKSAFQVLDESTLKDMMLKTTFDTLYISDIGHGMTGGPIAMGRFGQGKYIPPDRSNEIYPIPMQEDMEASKEAAEEADAETSEAKAQKSIITAMMEEVIRGRKSGGDRLTYIRDAERFTEITTSLQSSTEAGTTNENNSSVDIPIPEAMLAKKKDEKCQELDLD